MEQQGVEHSFRQALEKKQAVIGKLEEAKVYFAAEFDKKSALAYAKTLADQVEDSIDRLEINKDSVAYTFRTSLNSGIEKYFYYIFPLMELNYNQIKELSVSINDLYIVPFLFYDIKFIIQHLSSVK